MRILQLIAGLDIGAAHGGAERFGLELALALRAAGHDVTLCAFWQRATPLETAWLERLRAAGLPVFHAARWRGRGYLPAYAAGVAALLRRARARPFDLVHSHFQFGTLAALAVRAGGGARRALRTAHVTREWGPGLPNALLRALFTTWVYPLRLDGEAAVSRAVLDRLLARPAARLRPAPRLIYNGIPAAAFDPPVAPAPRPPGPPRVGSVGRLTAQKDYPTLLAALALLADGGLDFRCLLAGGGEQQPALERQARALGLGERLNLLGPCADVPALLAGLDLFVLPSRWEGLPTVLLEAAAAGLPVVATAVPGTVELVADGRTGWLVPPGDPSALAAALRDALSHPAEARRRAALARENARAFTIERAARQYLAWYRECLDPPART